MTGRHLRLIVVFLLVFAVNVQAAAPVSVIVKLLPGANLSAITSLLGGTILDTIPGTNTLLVRLPNLPLLSPILRLLGVEWIESNRGVKLPSIASLPLNVPYGNASEWYATQPSLQLVRAGAAQRFSKGEGMLIADINTQIDMAHPALRGHIGAGHDFVSGNSTNDAGLNDDQSTAGFLDDDQSTAGFLDDDQSTAGFLDGNGIRLFDDQSTAGFLDNGGAKAHGTFCVGLIVAVAPSATIMPLRAFDDNGDSDLFRLAKAIRYAKQNGAHVINMSFGTLTDSKVLREAIEYAKSGGVVLVASAGNNNTSAPQYPAAYPGVIAVASTDLFDRKASFSNFGSYVFVDAPGKNIISAAPNGRYGISSGTSFSAPIVAGMAAMIRSVQYNGVSTTISNSTVNIDSRNPKYKGKLGHGRIDILKAVRR